MSDDTWRSPAEREKLIQRMVTLLGESISSQETLLKEKDRLLDACRRYEASVFSTSSNKVDYAKKIAETIVSLREKAAAAKKQDSLASIIDPAATAAQSAPNSIPAPSVSFASNPARSALPSQGTASVSSLRSNGNLNAAHSPSTLSQTNSPGQSARPSVPSVPSQVGNAYIGVSAASRSLASVTPVPSAKPPPTKGYGSIASAVELAGRMDAASVAPSLPSSSNSPSSVSSVPSSLSSAPSKSSQPSISPQFASRDTVKAYVPPQSSQSSSVSTSTTASTTTKSPAFKPYGSISAATRGLRRSQSAESLKGLTSFASAHSSAHSTADFAALEEDLEATLNQLEALKTDFKNSRPLSGELTQVTNVARPASSVSSSGPVRSPSPSPYPTVGATMPANRVNTVSKATQTETTASRPISRNGAAQVVPSSSVSPLFASSTPSFSVSKNNFTGSSEAEKLSRLEHEVQGNLRREALERQAKQSLAQGRDDMAIKQRIQRFEKLMTKPGAATTSVDLSLSSLSPISSSSSSSSQSATGASAGRSISPMRERSDATAVPHKKTAVIGEDAIGTSPRGAPIAMQARPSAAASSPSEPSPPTRSRGFYKDGFSRSALSARTSTGEEMLCKPGEIIVRFVLPGEIQIQLPCKLSDSLSAAKAQLWAKIMSEQSLRSRLSSLRAASEYVFRADQDDYISEESLKLLDTPYIEFCVANRLCPEVQVVERSLLKHINVQIGAVVGKPLCWSVSASESNEFRRQMTRVRYNKYHRMGTRPTVTLSSRETQAATMLSPSFLVNIELSKNFSKTLNCDAQQTVSSTFDAIVRLYSKFLEKDPNEYVLKFKGREEYLLDGNARLIHIEAIRSLLRKKQKIELVLASRDMLEERHQDLLNDEKFRLSNIKLGALPPSIPIHPSNALVIWECDKELKARVTSVDNLNSLNLEPFGFKQNKGLRVCAVLSFYHDDLLIGELRTEEAVFLGGNPPVWKAMYPVNDKAVLWRSIPWGSVMHAVVYASANKGAKMTPIAWANLSMTEYRDRVIWGYRGVKLWTRRKPDPKAPPVENYEDANAPVLHVDVEILNTQLYWPHSESVKVTKLDPSKAPKPLETDQARLEAIFGYPPLAPLTTEDRRLLWQHRVYIFLLRPEQVAKFVLSIPWENYLDVKEAYSMLAQWPLLKDPVAALELLNPRFFDKRIREYCVKNLDLLSDTEIGEYLLQLVEALKHEPHHDSALARFLMLRALMNRNVVGHYFFWYMKAQLHQQEYTERFEMLLEAYLRNCGSFLGELLHQTSLTDRLTTVARSVQAAPGGKTARVTMVGSDLGQVKLPSYFPVPISSTTYASGLIVDKCKSIQSKTMPLWLVFENADILADPIYTILKAGDDLRQDQLVLQMFSIMDNMWLRAGLDLRVMNYKIIATSNEVGWVEVVRDSLTTADIQKKAGGVSEIFSEQTLANWLRENNPTDQSYRAAVDTFIRSCAGCCVATYVLGIGDRHNDNIMINKNGNLFHIDFGKFLGNAQMFLAFKRDRAPFVFTPDMAYVMGGTQTAQFSQFVELCCRAYNVLRSNAAVFINLLAMMISTGIPELTCETDLNYILDAFSLTLSDSQATAKFTRLIDDSLNTMATRFNFAIHLLANPQ